MAEAPEPLPDIVMISEAQFVEKQLTPAFEALALAAEVTTMDKAGTKKFMEEAIARREIADDDFNPVFAEMPPAEEEKEPITLDDAKECVLRYAVSIGMIPTRLKTALDAYSDDLTQPERQIFDFFRNDSLADVTLINPISGASYKAHRVILASGSRYLLEVFAKHPVADMPTVKVPAPFNQKCEQHSDDQVSRILKYIYGNQNIGLIREEVSIDNFFSLYAQAYALGCERLLEDLRELSITSLLNDSTCLKLYLDAVEHQDTKIMEACSNVITERFEEIVSKEEPDNVEHMLSLNIENFVAILQADNLNLAEEDRLTGIVHRYIAIREKANKKCTNAEQETLPALWALLSEEEKENRNAAFQAKVDAKTAADAEA